MSGLQKIALVAAILTLIAVASVIGGFWDNEPDALSQATKSESTSTPSAGAASPIQTQPGGQLSTPTTTPTKQPATATATPTQLPLPTPTLPPPPSPTSSATPAPPTATATVTATPGPPPPDLVIELTITSGVGGFTVPPPADGKFHSGRLHAFQVTATNTGGPTTGPVSIVIQIPSGMALIFPVGGLTANLTCSASGQTVSCFTQELASNSQVAAAGIFAAAWDSPSLLDLCAETSTGGEINLTDNDGCLSLPVDTTPQCDLVVEKTALYPGIIRYEITVTWECKSDHLWWTIGDIILVEDLPGDLPVEVIQIVSGNTNCQPNAGFQTSISCNLSFRVWNPPASPETITFFLAGSANCTNLTTVDADNLIGETDETNNSVQSLAFPC